MHFTLKDEGGLRENACPEAILHNFEKIPAHIFPSQEDASENVADIICYEISKAEKAGGTLKLGLSTGRTPRSLYQILRSRYEEGMVSFRRVEIFTIDEYYPLDETAIYSRNRIIHNDLLNHIDIPEGNVHIPDGHIGEDAVSDWCERFDRLASGLDLLVIGIGEEGQTGFNESGSSLRSRTRTVLLPYASRKRQARNFIGEIENTPHMAITMGMGTMMSAKRVILMAFGEDKAGAVNQAAEGEMSPACPASFFQNHRDAAFFIDRDAAAKLTRTVAPWLIGPCEWSNKFRRKAVFWLCRKLGKPILELSQKDYLENSLGELLELYGSYDKINIEVFNELQHCITGWPGGKPDADDSNRPVPASPFPKRVLIFSPHPDDDVISMGGTFIRLVHQGHDVHVAYQTSGNVAVHDDVVSQMFDAACELGFGDRREELARLLEEKRKDGTPSRELLDIKAAIRRSEAKAAVRSFGLDESRVHFLNLPFYESGGVKKNPRSQEDIDIATRLIDKLKPHQIYLAGDLADPHGTHRVCTEIVLEALAQVAAKPCAEWMDDCTIWLYRGAWLEWETYRVDMAVPLSPEEVVEKRYAIYHHLSQKDIVPFPGDDPREFWQRAEDRTAGTAREFRELGMARYQAMEVFVKLPAKP